MWYFGYFSISFEKITFYTEILTRKVELWKTQQNNFSSQNFSVENNYLKVNSKNKYTWVVKCRYREKIPSIITKNNYKYHRAADIF